VAACLSRRKAPRLQSRRIRSLRNPRTNLLRRYRVLTGIGEDIFSCPGGSMKKPMTILNEKGKGNNEALNSLFNCKIVVIPLK
jgi:hypothetical protein